MQTPTNTFKQRLLQGDTLDGLWFSLASPVAAEALSLAGFDWMLFDTEHAPAEIASVQPLLQAAAVGTASAVVRPAWNDKVLIKRILDIGAQTLLIPFVETPAEAAAAVAATRYPPDGVRGVAGSTRASRYGFAGDYFARANDEICVLVQIETRSAMENLEAIAMVPGVDGVFIGPSDLGASMGHLGNPGHDAVQAALQQAVQRLAAVNKPAGILATRAEDALRYRGWGYAFVAGGTDMGLLTSGARALRARMLGDGGA
ncbi:MAG: HpcH/HpaI aldolase family protein [Pararhodobacter sp.]